MKKNKYTRRASALKRLEEQIKIRRISREFHDRIEGLSSKEKEDEIVSYWDRKTKEHDTLKIKVI